MNLSQLNELSLNNVGDWPTPVKAVATLVLCAAAAFAVYHFDTNDQLTRLDAERTKEAELRSSFETKQAKAANLEAYEQQLEAMKESFGTMLRQLPDKTEVAGLLVDVSQTGLAAGLEFKLFQPEGEGQKDFYAELPIKVNVTGHYHEFGRFVSGLAALSRIVTIHDVKIDAPPPQAAKTPATDPAGPKLNLQATVKTYRYLDEAGLK
jgi:type IV pilus assembly protein PilO